uniref:Uncharacterized protein n=1 Tax=Opuntia streptacantha TaxID=393608 RepID=A0A7C8YTX6_OPUST
MSTNSTGDYRFIVYCFSACQGPFVRSSSGYYLMSTVRAVILLHTKMAQRLLSDSYGKCFEYTSSAPTTSEVCDGGPSLSMISNSIKSKIKLKDVIGEALEMDQSRGPRTVGCTVVQGPVRHPGCTPSALPVFVLQIT